MLVEMRFRDAVLIVCALAIPSTEAKNNGRTKRETTNIQIAVTQINVLQNQLNMVVTGDTRDAMHMTLESAKDDIEKSGGKFDPTQFKDSVNGVIGQIGKMTSGDPAQIAMGITESLSNLAALVPGPYGAALSSVFGIASTLIGQITGNNKGMSQVVDEIVAKNLRKERINELKGDIVAASNILQNSQAFMLAFQKNDMSAYPENQQQNDLNALGQQVKVKDGLVVLSRLEHFIKTESARATDAAQVQEVLGMVRAYVQLSAVRHSLMSTLRAVYAHTHLTALTENGLGYVIEIDVNRTREALRFLHTPSNTTAHVAAAFIPSKEVMVTKYMKSLGIEFTNETTLELTEECVTLQDPNAPEWYVHIEGESYDTVWLLELTDGDDSYRKMKFVQNGDYLEWRQPGHDGWLFYRVSMNSQLKMYEFGSGKITEDIYLFRVIKMDDGNYFITNKVDGGSTVYWWSDPNAFGAFWLYAGAYGGKLNPGGRAYWKITKTSC